MIFLRSSQLGQETGMGLEEFGVVNVFPPSEDGVSGTAIVGCSSLSLLLVEVVEEAASLGDDGVLLEGVGLPFRGVDVRRDFFELLSDTIEEVIISGRSCS